VVENKDGDVGTDFLHLLLVGAVQIHGDVFALRLVRGDRQAPPLCGHVAEGLPHGDHLRTERIKELLSLRVVLVTNDVVLPTLETQIQELDHGILVPAGKVRFIDPEDPLPLLVGTHDPALAARSSGGDRIETEVGYRAGDPALPLAAVGDQPQVRGSAALLIYPREQDIIDKQLIFIIFHVGVLVEMADDHIVEADRGDEGGGLHLLLPGESHDLYQIAGVGVSVQGSGVHRLAVLVHHRLVEREGAVLVHACEEETLIGGDHVQIDPAVGDHVRLQLLRRLLLFLRLFPGLLLRLCAVLGVGAGGPTHRRGDGDLSVRLRSPVLVPLRPHETGPPEEPVHLCGVSVGVVREVVAEGLICGALIASVI